MEIKNGNSDGNLAVSMPQDGSPCPQVPLEFAMLVFVGEGKLEELEKNFQNKDKNIQVIFKCQMLLHLSGNQTQANQMRDEHSHHCAISTPEISQLFKVLHFSKLVGICQLTLCNIFSHLESMTLGTQEEETDLIH